MEAKIRVFKKNVPFFLNILQIRTRARAATVRLQTHRHRVRHENLHNFEKNLDQNGL